MPYQRHKPVYFVLEGVNAFATSYYFFYLFFFLRDHFGFGNAQNLAACALHGLVYTFSSWHAGRFSQRAGYFTALPLGFAIMAAALLGSCALSSPAGLLAALGLWTWGMSFTWPTLEALASEGESGPRLQRMIGIYNLVWAGGSAIAYFVGGALKEKLGDPSIFWLPALLHLCLLAVVFWLRRQAGPAPASHGASPPVAAAATPPQPTPSGLPPRAFLVMAWLANPFAYVAINAAGPVIPQLAERLGMSTAQAGYFCSIWFFARLATFAVLWRWTRWHYRFRWLLWAFLVMIVSFAGMLLASQLLVIALAQVGLGCAVGLIYYSSLFYSMDVGETKGEHGGIHEAVIGSGVFGGAAIGSAGQYLLGGQSSSTWVVSAVLVLGLVALLAVRRRFAAPARTAAVALLGLGATAALPAASVTAAEPVFDVKPDGGVAARLSGGPSPQQITRYDFGMPTNPPTRRWLENDTIPVCRSTWEFHGIRYHQIALVTRLDKGDLMPGGTLPPDAVLLVQLTGENTAAEYTEASAAFSARTADRPWALGLRGNTVCRSTGAETNVIVVFDLPTGGIVATNGPGFRFSGSMPPGTSGAMTLKIPVNALIGPERLELLQEMEFDEELKRVNRYWASQATGPSRPPVPLRLDDTHKP